MSSYHIFTKNVVPFKTLLWQTLYTAQTKLGAPSKII